MKALIETEGCDINQGDWRGFTPLIWAAREGKEEVVRLLLPRIDVNHNQPSNEGQTPLWMASLKGHSGVVRLLLASDHVDPNKADRHGQTPPNAALIRGGEVVRPVFRTVQGPHRDGGDDAKKTGRNTTGRDR